MKLNNPFRTLTRFELALWIVSLTAITISAILAGFRDPLSTIASLIGVTALIFVAKGAWIGQVLVILFATFYGIVSLHFHYYGEMITYVGMSLPMAVVSLVEWIRHPYRDSDTVEVRRITARHVLFLALSDVAVTVVFYFILKALGTSRLIVSTLSVTTSFAAASLTFLRSPYYALAYTVNDLILIVLWVLAALTDPSCIPMVVCFVMFLANDIYGFISWRRMQRAQRDDAQHETSAPSNSI